MRFGSRTGLKFLKVGVQALALDLTFGGEQAARSSLEPPSIKHQRMQRMNFPASSTMVL
jgi:hypothetical protein